MIGFLRNATGTSAKALSPRRPSDSTSTTRPVTNAMIIAPVVPILIEMQSTITGRMDSIR